MDKNLSLSLSFGIGAAHPHFDSIAVSYREARAAQEYCIYHSQSNIVTYQDIKCTAASYPYPLEIEAQLITSVKTGNEARMKQLLDRVFNENFRSSALTLEFAKCFYFDIMSTAIKIMNESSSNDHSEFGADPMTLLTSCENSVEMEHVLRNIFDVLCRRARSEQSSRNARLKDGILGYIKDNCCNSELSLTLAAEAFSITPSYLSRFLKESAGVNFVDYLRGRRIEKSMEYLQNTRLSINEIAEKVGYTSGIVYIRNFKKIHGITPSQMRSENVLNQ